MVRFVLEAIEEGVAGSSPGRGVEQVAHGRGAGKGDGVDLTGQDLVDAPFQVGVFLRGTVR